MIIKTKLYEFHLKDENDLTYGEKRDLQKVFLKKTKLNNIQAGLDLTGDSIIDFQDELLKKILFKIKVLSTEEIIETDCFDYLMKLKTSDPDQVYDKVNSLFNSIFTKKK